MSLPQFIGMVIVFAFVAILLMHIWEDTVAANLREARRLERETPSQKPRPYDWKRDMDA